ncbi:MAG: NAD(P)H-hydrate dehydratase, partial [Deltaproteobacteria bacterium]
PILEVKLTEAMTEPLPEEEGFLSPASLPPLLEALKGKTALAIGPGMGTKEGVKEMLSRLLRDISLPTVIDADGINLLASAKGVLQEIKAPSVLTPHPGEMARLIGVETAQIQAKRIETAREVAERYNCVVVLKGSRTVIASPSGEVFINPTGNPGMASGGTGDVLTGMIGALLAQGMEPLEAAKLAVYLHGLSGDLAAEEVGEVALVATDLLRCLPKAIKELQGWRPPS